MTAQAHESAATAQQLERLVSRFTLHADAASDRTGNIVPLVPAA
jgi:hypothetical protein